MMCVATKSSMRYLDTCDDILMMVYEGVEAKRFLTFLVVTVHSIIRHDRPYICT